MKETTNIFGYNFICAENYDTLADRVISDVRTGEAGLTNFITPNAHGINMYARLPEVNVFCQQSRYVLPDGQPIVWLSRFTDRKIKQRLTGSDFFPVMFRKIKGAEHRCLFIMSNEELGKMILTEKPDARYLVPPFFSISETDRVGDFVLNAAEIIQKFNLNYVFIGISEPKQGLLAKLITERLRRSNYKSSCVFFFLGASYEFYFGLKKRAPVFFQKTGMEWVYRLGSEPGRMYKRYIFGNFEFLLRAVRWILSK